MRMPASWGEHCDVCHKETGDGPRLLLHTGKFDLTQNLPVVEVVCASCSAKAALDPIRDRVAEHLRSRPWVSIVDLACMRCGGSFGDSFWAVVNPTDKWVHVCDACFGVVRRDGLRLLPMLKVRPKKRPAVKKRPVRKVFDADLNLGVVKHEGELDVVAVRSAYAFLRRGAAINIRSTNEREQSV